MEIEKKPNPDKLLRDALMASKYPELESYFRVVLALREQRELSWRDMAAWFGRKGIQVSHTTLRDFYQSEIRRHPEPTLDELREEIDRISNDELMLSSLPEDAD